MNRFLRRRFYSHYHQLGMYALAQIAVHEESTDERYV